MKNQQRGELAVCGLEAVRALASARPDEVLRLFFIEDRAREFGRLCSLLASRKRPYRMVDSVELERLSGTKHHQGVVAMVAWKPLAPVTDAMVAAWARSGARLVALDGVGDDHNIGAIARAAAFFGWTGLVLGADDEGSRLSTSSYRVARGALERVGVYVDESIERFVRRASPLMATIGADHNGRLELGSYARTLSGAAVVVMGNEEHGLSSGVRSACGSLVRIPGGGVESLNVAQAASIFLYELAPRAGASPSS